MISNLDKHPYSAYKAELQHSMTLYHYFLFVLNQADK
jgi:hypothetical protein